MSSDFNYAGEDFRGANIPRRQQPMDLDRVTQYAINLIPINGKPYADDETAWYELNNVIDDEDMQADNGITIPDQNEDI